MIGNLPESSALAALLKRMPNVAAKNGHTIAGAVKVVENGTDIRPELRRVLEGFLRASIKRLETKRTRGHDYGEYTVYRRVQVAADFCRFLEGQGIQSWQQVMQRHLDAYCAARTRQQGQRVYPFVSYARRVAPVSAKLQSPRNRPRPKLDFAPPFEVQAQAVARLIAAPVDEAVLVGLFVAVYAQRITDCRKLHLSHFRVRNDRVQARFAEEWMPLDRAVAARVLKIVPDVAVGIRSEDQALFTLDPRSYSRRIRAICDLPIKKLRFGALASVIRRGVTDRAALRALLGVSMDMIEDAERLMEWDLQWTVDPEIVENRNRIIRVRRERLVPLSHRVQDRSPLHRDHPGSGCAVQGPLRRQGRVLHAAQSSTAHARRPPF